MPRLNHADNRRISETGETLSDIATWKRSALGVLTATSIWFGQTASACDCDKGHAAPAMNAPFMDSGPMDEGPGPEAMLGGAGGFVYSPPPGTLGMTYQRPSWPIPAAKPPRVGMIQIRAAGVSNIVVQDTNEFRLEDALEGGRHPADPTVWYFESKPLIPGAQRIHRVLIGREDGTTEERYVRLIMGRIVTLDL